MGFLTVQQISQISHQSDHPFRCVTRSCELRKLTSDRKIEKTYGVQYRQIMREYEIQTKKIYGSHTIVAGKVHDFVKDNID